MKVLHLANTATATGGGISDVARNLFLAQRKLGIDAHLWFPATDSEFRTVAREMPEVAHCLRPIRSIKAMGLRLPVGLFNHDAETFGFDVIHKHGIWLPHSLIVRAASEFVPTMISPHGGLMPYARRNSKLFKFLAWVAYEGENFRRASALAVCSEQEREGLDLPEPSSPTYILENGVSDEFFVPQVNLSEKRREFRMSHGLFKDAKILLYLGRLHPSKGIELLLESVARLAPLMNAERWHVIIAGSGEGRYQASLAQLVRSLGISGLVTFIGPVYGREKIDLYRLSDLFALPSFSENFGIVVAEAMVSGLPVITTENTPWAVLSSEKMGDYVPATPVALSAAIEKLVRLEPMDREAMGSRGISYATSRFRWKAIAEKSLMQYEQVIKGASERAKAREAL